MDNENMSGQNSQGQQQDRTNQVDRQQNQQGGDRTNLDGNQERERDNQVERQQNQQGGGQNGSRNADQERGDQGDRDKAQR